MKQHYLKVHKALENCIGPARVLFGLLAAERLRACCTVANPGSDTGRTYLVIINKAYSIISNKEDIVPEVFDDMQLDLEKIIPEGGEPLQVQAQSSIICLLTALRLMKDDHVDAATETVNAVVDALDNYTFFTYRLITGEMLSPENYLLLDRELSRQLNDLQFVQNYGKLTASDIVNRRIENLQFAVPVAVGERA